MITSSTNPKWLLSLINFSLTTLLQFTHSHPTFSATPWIPCQYYRHCYTLLLRTESSHSVQPLIHIAIAVHPSYPNLKNHIKKCKKKCKTTSNSISTTFPKCIMNPTPLFDVYQDIDTSTSSSRGNLILYSP